jgi:hypothetical protein
MNPLKMTNLTWRIKEPRLGMLRQILLILS